MLPINFFWRAVRDFADRSAVIDDRGSITYRELGRSVAAVADGLRAMDPTPLSRVGICAFNSREHLVAWLAVLEAGKTWVPLYPKSPREELIRRMRFTDATILITDEQWKDLATAADAQLLLLTGASKNSISALCKNDVKHAASTFDVDLGQAQAIKFTGGSTGVPKGVIQSFRGWNTNIISQIDAWGLGPNDRFLVCSPMTHGTSTYLLPTLATGGALVIADQLKPSQILDIFERHKITNTFVAPTVIYMFLEQKGVEHRSFALRNLIYGGGPMRESAIHDAQKVFGTALASTYGQTEASQIATFITGRELSDGVHAASVGREAPLTQVAIMADDGSLRSVGDSGEIVVRGDLVMSGYLKQPDVTAKTIRDGWLHTGDIGAIDEKGYLFIFGRLKQMIISGGFNVYPIDVEDALSKYEDIADCAVFGVPDQKWGEAVHAAVCLKPGSVLDEGALLRHVRSLVGPIATPKMVHQYEVLPRNAYGKLERNRLVADYVDSLRKKTS